MLCWRIKYDDDDDDPAGLFYVALHVYRRLWVLRSNNVSASKYIET